ncbi:tRNA(His) guanylyltransferase Thg1 family protein [Methanospirillum stamsii]|uniref:tRNA(His) guanylyltransferase n=1 Tax=Methanospirillum stamsii TaxID=1277351 RepID=A0A2V2NBM7_9EURY|nr:tRNA(His) guanylyltransferase Thg1 family protein [Methanospirillum stamsii]PWR75026.1 tRNA 5'-guanylyltransferase [Methanospirillum stamsii]
MKEREIYADLKTLSPLMVRLDGRAFHQVTKTLSFSEPFDEIFSSAMAEVTKSLLSDAGFAPVLGFTFSDEISLYFTESPFLGRIEKIDSVLASFASSSLTIALELKEPVSFDARIIPVTPDHVLPYLSWRQQEAWRNHINGWSQKLLKDEGYTSQETASMLHAMKAADIHEFCFQRGVNLAMTPAWQRRGILVYRTVAQKDGYNPKTGKQVTALRNIITIDRDIPLFTNPEGKNLINGLIRNVCDMQ